MTQIERKSNSLATLKGKFFIFCLSISIYYPTAPVMGDELKALEQGTASPVLPGPAGIRVSSGAFQGALTIGGFYETNLFGIETSIGYSPETLVGQDIWQLNFKPYVKGKLRFFSRPIYFRQSLGIIYGRHHELFFRLPDRYEENYYTPSSIRYISESSLGIKLSGQRVFFNYAFLDTEAALLINANQLKIKPIGSWGLGLEYLL